ncbi:hypothetical protein F4861DRAFT_134057 [Xylaria intraflava]|nr:hypothetical protein F4861DRAFT_134057 [Xylaria intraflava]
MYKCPSIKKGRTNPSRIAFSQSIQQAPFYLTPYTPAEDSTYMEEPDRNNTSHGIGKMGSNTKPTNQPGQETSTTKSNLPRVFSPPTYLPACLPYPLSSYLLPTQPTKLITKGIKKALKDTQWSERSTTRKGKGEENQKKKKKTGRGRGREIPPSRKNVHIYIYIYIYYSIEPKKQNGIKFRHTSLQDLVTLPTLYINEREE